MNELEIIYIIIGFIGACLMGGTVMYGWAVIHDKILPSVRNVKQHFVDFYYFVRDWNRHRKVTKYLNYIITHPEASGR